jgi:hypothetical protein
MTKVWLDAGFKTERVDVEGRRLVFRRLRGPHSPFGTLRGSVQVAPGVDLTEPADPEWAELADRARMPEEPPSGRSLSRSPRGEGQQPVRHPLFGAHRGLMRITPGADLTEPAAGRWDDDR